MDHQKFQSAVLVVLCGIVIMLAALIWSQNIAIENISSAIGTLSRSGSISTPNEPAEPVSPAPAAEPATMAPEKKEGPFMAKFNEFSSDRPSPVAYEKAPKGMIELASVRVEDCPPVPDGVCGYSLFIYGHQDWEEGTVTEFYFAESAGGPLAFYGPYTGDLRNIVLEANAIGTIKLR